MGEGHDDSKAIRDIQSWANKEHRTVRTTCGSLLQSADNVAGF